MHTFSTNSFPIIGTKWYYSSKFMTPDMGYYELEYTNDTLISEYNCKILTSSRYNSYRSIEEKSKIILLLETKKIYQHINNRFYLLYDFTANVGDTIKSKITFMENPTLEKDMWIKINEKSDTLINNVQYATYSFNIINLGNDCISFEGRAIENIGNVTNFLLPIDCIIADSQKPTEFRCYQHPEILLKSNNYKLSECDSVYVFNPNSLSNLLVENDFAITISSDYLNYSYKREFKGNESLFIFDSSGKILITDKLSIYSSVCISNLPSGIYFLAVNINSIYKYFRFIK